MKPTVFRDRQSRASKISHVESIRAGEAGSEAWTSRETWEHLRRHGGAPEHGGAPDTYLSRVLFHPLFETIGGFVILLNFLIMTLETNAAAINDANMMIIIGHANRILLLYYTAECTLRLSVMRRIFFRVGWNNFDLFIVVGGVVGELLEGLQITAGMNQMTMLKSLRMLRLLRLMRLFVAFRELYVLVAGIGRCMKTLFWASGLIFIVLNVWAILSVEFLNEKVQELVPSGVFRTCGWCGHAFSNIWNANITWFAIISSSDWTDIGRPLAEEFTWPYAFFVACVFIVIWGLLNLIVAAIVDANIAAREDDVAIAARIADQGYKQAFQSFEQMCKNMDMDGSGDVSVKEFKMFLQQNLELQMHLKTMGIQERDVNDLLHIMDEDGSGALECAEFIEQFTSMRTLVEKTSLFFLLKYCQSMQGKLSKLNQLMKGLSADMAAVKSSCGVKLRRAKCQALNSDLLIQSSTASPRSSQAGNEESVAPPGAQSHAAHTLRTTAETETPHVDLKRLPPGWYYIGASMPSEASVWCSTENANHEVNHTSNCFVTKLNIDDNNKARLMPDDQRWEPLTTNGFQVHHAKHVYVKTPIGDVQLPPEIVQALASVDRFIDHICDKPDTKVEDQTLELIASSSIRIHDAKHVYLRASIGDVQLPPEIIDALTSVDRFVDRECKQFSAAAYHLGSEHYPLHVERSSFDFKSRMR